MDDFVIAVIKDAPLLGIVVYIIYLANGTGKQIIEALQRIEAKLDYMVRGFAKEVAQTREESALSEAAQARSAYPRREDTR